MKSSHLILMIGSIGILVLVVVMMDQFMKHPLIHQVQQLKTTLKNRFLGLEEFSLVLRQPSVKNIGMGLFFSYTHKQSSESAIEVEMDQFALTIWKEVQALKGPTSLKEKNSSSGNDKKDLKSRLNYVLIKNQTMEKKFTVEELKQKTDPFFVAPKKENPFEMNPRQPFPKK